MADLFDIERRLDALLAEKDRVICAIDGRAGAGKTTLADSLAAGYDAAVIHADHFCLRPGQRTAQRLAEPGGNLDRERLLESVLLPLSQNKRAAYRPYDCSLGRLTDGIELPEARLYIVEGSYSLHPELRPYYDLAVFVTTDSETQLRRIEARDHSKLAAFREKWIPLEELYFKTFDVARGCDVMIET